VIACVSLVSWRLSDLGGYFRSLAQLERSSSPARSRAVSRNYPALPCAVSNSPPPTLDGANPHSKIFLSRRRHLGRDAFVETRDDTALDPRKVALDAIDQKTLGLQDGGSKGGLPRSDFDREDAVAR
jgi:hypothetical protein